MQAAHDFPCRPVEQRDKLPEHNRGALKALGDPSYIPESQTAGTYNTADNAEDTETFSRLAKAYVFRGQARKDLCAINAQVSLILSALFDLRR